MAITEYYCEKSQRNFLRVYVNKQSSKYKHIREQKLIPKIPLDQRELAEQLDSEWTDKCTRKVELREAQGCCWDELIDRFELHYKRYPTRKMSLDTVRDHVSRAKNYTKDWLKKPCGEITFTDGCELFEEMQDKELSLRLRKTIKGSINKIYKWGIQRRFIVGVDDSPVNGVEVEDLFEIEEEKDREILTVSQIHSFVDRAFKTNHPWKNIWKFDLYTGLRAQELNGLRKEDIRMIRPEVAKSLENKMPKNKINYGHIKIKRQWSKKARKCKRVKGKYWRTVPLNSTLYWWLIDYLPKASFGKDQYGKRVFPKIKAFDNGGQAAVLRTFCASEKLKSIKYHTLRACWATQVLRSGVSATDLMLMGGWRDYKTMMIYIRLAGLETVGATEGLDFESLDVKHSADLTAAEWAALKEIEEDEQGGTNSIDDEFQNLGHSQNIEAEVLQTEEITESNIIPLFG